MTSKPLSKKEELQNRLWRWAKDNGLGRSGGYELEAIVDEVMGDE